MKKAGIITHYDVHNHGAHLQMYALKRCLERLGYDAKALRYQKNYDFLGGPGVSNKYNITLKSVPIYLMYVLRNGVKRTLYNYNKRRLLADFRNSTELVGDYYSAVYDIDVVVIGSDEIFSIEAGPNPWYYGIGVPCKNQISYAASFGPTTYDMIEKHNVESLVSAGLNQLKGISVRDENSRGLVKHFTGRDAEIVCDPVLLYGFPEYIAEAKQNSPSKEKYCIVYSYDDNMNDDETIRFIKEFSKKNNLRIYSVAYFHKWCDANIQVKPLDIFRWFANAEIVFTDTFHGSVISIVTETQFIAKIKNNGNKLAFLLEQFGLSGRKVADFSEINTVIREKIDYDDVNERLVNIRRKSFLFLEKNLCGEGM